MTDFAGLLKSLASAEVEFILIGGAAAIAHGSSRMTEDVDVVYRRSGENVVNLVQALAGKNPYLRGAPPGLPFSWDEETIQRGLNFTLTTDSGAIDLFAEIPGGGTYDDLLPHCVELSLFGVVCLCIDAPTLIRVKRAAGRPKDLEAIAEIESLLAEEDD